MSGPKTARYTLSAEEWQRIQEENYRRSLRAQIKAQAQAMREREDELRGLLARLSSIHGNAHTAQVPIDRIQTLLSSLSDYLKEGISSLSSDSIPALEASKGTMSAFNAKLRGTLEPLRGECVSLGREHARQLERDINAGFSTRFTPVKAKMSAGESNSPHLHAEQIHKLEQLSQSRDLTPEQTARAYNLLQQFDDIKDPAFADNFIALTVLPIMREFESYLAAYEANEGEWRELLARESELSRSLGLEFEAPIFSPQALSRLRESVPAHEAQLLERQEQEHISRALDETMRELGYDLLGERMKSKRSGKRFQNVLYAFDAETAVSVTYSSDGKITMELGILDATDRLPTVREAEHLASDMEHFCVDFRQLEMRLREKGVIVAQRIAMLPPSGEYAQVINIADYRMEGGQESEERCAAPSVREIRYMKGE